MHTQDNDARHSYRRHSTDNLTKRQVLLLPNGTHGPGSACVDGIVAAFVDTAARVDAKCVDAMKLGEFFVPP